MAAVDSGNSLSQAPKWLEALENGRKRPHKLAHEIGAGAPCLACKEACRGLNLHFWRKVCIECKCKKEVHDFDEEEDYAQFQILFGNKKEKNALGKLNFRSELFEWLPPDTPHELAVEYLKSIHLSECEDASYRKQQLGKQIPIHDVDPNACHNLSEQEIKEFEEYIVKLKKSVVGQGKVIKYCSESGVRKNNGIHLKSSSENEREMKNHSVADRIRVNQKNIPLKDVSCRSSTFKKNSFSLNPVEEKTFLSPTAGVQFKKNTGLNFDKTNSKEHLLSVPYKVSAPSVKNEDLIGGKIATASPPSSIGSSNNFTEVGVNEKYGETEKNELFLHGTSSVGKVALSENGAEKYETNVNNNAVDRFESLNISRSGEDASFPSEPEPRRKDEDDDESGFFPEPPATCQQCLNILNPNEVVVEADREEGTALWHAGCFVCETCREPLVDLIYFYRKGKVYCGRHYAEVANIPRCFACDELIFVREFTCAEEKFYHLKHFCCFHCDRPLAGMQYVSKDSNPVCLDCYRMKYEKKCRACGLSIGATDRRVSWKNLDFHASSMCFQCATCRRSLLAGKFVAKDDRVFCSKDCLSRWVE